VKIVRTKTDLRKEIKKLKKSGKIALVPTMGALHGGHVRLVEEARKNSGAVIATIFINPTQFVAGEDFDLYPRQEKKDISALKKAKVDLCYIPNVEEIYPNGYGTMVTVADNTEILCGASRKGHFNGVATVITKLFLQVMPNLAFFGEKDFQQLHIIKQLAQDLFIPVEIRGVATVREKDGLATSSRNKYLDEEERERAPEIFRMLSIMRQRMDDDSEESLRALEKWGKDYLKEKNIKQVEYVEIRDEETLELADHLTPGRPVRILAAVQLGNARLIDNIRVRV